MKINLASQVRLEKKKPIRMNQTQKKEITDAIKEDHHDLKKFIKVMTDQDAKQDEKKQAFLMFADLLKSHAGSEEKALYEKALKSPKLSFRSHEGYIEHKVADLLMKTAKEDRISERWEAEIKVLGELVKHHIKEEESDFLPKIKKTFDKDERLAMGAEFLKLREESQIGISEKNAGALSESLH